ncbi:MAG TPA: indole-3-glycerol phosphate synthase TrpC [Ornithinimicrobium sp.]|uniref:indole-3-glycerol phosphate synthase TrpC n=1 Tax=Ornithinimicrobium sp. TaxID=1977084 RepID=UPI002B461A23|nr:indole-3-glycerol phosphate synthase TrpC [Ornithinimicrobium sp.]HKJ11858.1 indole-3-glycerol phosphate synthase TrpC [Ornithinimicrobium sp.]
MPSVLDEIVRDVREDMAQRRRDVPPAEIRSLATAAPPPVAALSALRGRPEVHLIAEIKRASPSRGPLAPDLDPATLAADYAAGGASAISVLTEPRRFRGSLADLDEVRQVVDIPLLRKDFIVDDYQVDEARAHGADLVLLIVAALDDDTLARLLARTRSWGMEALVEVHDTQEAERAMAAGAALVGVNNRNLRTLRVDRTTFARVAPQIPAGVTLVAESGVRDVGDVVQARAAGAHAVLVGEALVTGGRPREAVAELVAAGAPAREPQGVEAGS